MKLSNYTRLLRDLSLYDFSIFLNTIKHHVILL